MAGARSQEEKERPINSTTRPTVALPAWPAFEASPGPLTLASSLFPGEADEGDPNEPNCSSYTQLLIGRIGGAGIGSSSSIDASGGNDRVDNERGRIGAGMPTSQQQPHFLLSPGFSPSPFLESSGFYPHTILVSYKILVHLRLCFIGYHFCIIGRSIFPVRYFINIYSLS
jgi:hypothetical protein